ncbi:hypothetical protein M0802_015583 [Mischocyttarus mexicanus]|nr:hypothetical protein M0802_015583 [Mischocyttarus mexicanus]
MDRKTVGKMPMKKRRVGPVESVNVNSNNGVGGSIKHEEAVDSVTCAEGFFYRDALLKAREKINLKDLGVDAFKIRRGVTGSFIFKLKGAECRRIATRFAEALNKAIPEAKVALPKRTGELVLCGLDAGVTKYEIIASIKGLVEGLESRDVRVGDIYSGKGRLGQAYVSAPLNAIKEMLKIGSISIGWSKARVRALSKRPLRCYRCQVRGHVGAYCPSPVSRVGLCHRCGREGHYAAACVNKLCCSVCKDAGRSAVGHVVGSLRCPPVPPPPPRKFTSAVKNKSVGVDSAVVATKGCDTNNNISMEVSDCTPTCALSVGGAKVVGALSQHINGE